MVGGRVCARGGAQARASHRSRAAVVHPPTRPPTCFLECHNCFHHLGCVHAAQEADAPGAQWRLAGEGRGGDTRGGGGGEQRSRARLLTGESPPPCPKRWFLPPDAAISARTCSCHVTTSLASLPCDTHLLKGRHWVKLKCRPKAAGHGRRRRGHDLRAGGAKRESGDRAR